MMDKHILSLLKQKNRVIIPELGAFIVKQSTPKTFVFNEFLKYNDGMLIDYVTNEESIPKDEATKKVEDYVAQINSALNMGESYTIENLGILKKDRSGKIQFQPDEGADEAPLYKEEPKTSNAETEKKEPEKKTESKDETPIELIEDSTQKPEEKKEDKDKNLAGIKKETPPPVVPPVENRKVTSVKPESEKTASAAGKKPTQQSKPSIEQKKYQPMVDPQKKSNKTGIWIALVAVVVVAIGVWIYLNRDFVFGGKEKDTQETVLGPSPEKPAEDLTISKTPESTTTEETKEDPRPEQQQAATNELQQPAQPKPQVEPAGKKYYIVAGCFQNENNANEYAAHLRDQGYGAEKFGKYGGLHAVSFESFTSYNDALRQLNKIRNNVEPEAWILYY